MKNYEELSLKPKVNEQSEAVFLGIKAYPCIGIDCASQEEFLEF